MAAFPGSAGALPAAFSIGKRCRRRAAFFPPAALVAAARAGLCPFSNQGDVRPGGRAVTIYDSLSMPICRRPQILRFLVTAAIRRPKLAIAVALVVLAALASTMTYTGFLVVGVLAEYLGTGRVVAGLLLGGLFARFPWIRNGKLRIVGLLPKPFRRPLIVGLLALCLLHFLSRGEYLPAGFTGFAAAFVLTYPWMRRAIVDRSVSSVFKFRGRPSPESDDMVIDGEFREKKD